MVAVLASAELDDAVRLKERVLVIARVSKVVQPTWASTGQVMSEQLVVFAYDDDFPLRAPVECVPLVVGRCARVDVRNEKGAARLK